MLTPYNTNLPQDLRELKEQIEAHARSFGLDFYETIFEVVDADDLNEIASYGGFPTRYPHWSFGMSYEELKKGYEYGLSKIYEMVINNDPCYAYLMRCNNVVDQKLVMAHVYGHCLAPDTLVETRTGAQWIRDIFAGEEVLTHRGVYRPVKLVARRWFQGKIYRIRVAGSRETVRITGEHPVYVLRPTPSALVEHGSAASQPAWVPAEQLQVGDVVVLPRPRFHQAEQAALEMTATMVLPRQCLYGSRVLSRGPAAEQVGYGHPFWEDEDFLYRPISDIETEDYDGLVYNFSVEEDESYALSAGMVVHNCDFFKNNAYFAHTSRKMMDEMANHGARIRRYVEKYGEDEVEAFVDRCMSIDDLIDAHSVAIKRRDEISRYDFSPKEEEDPIKGTRFKSKGYMDEYINPPGVLKAEEEEKKRLQEQAARNFPERPEKDVLLFLIEHAPLKGWQRDVLSIIRDEAYYFAPQAMTKIMNEGWASYWHSKIMTERTLQPWECVDYADHHSGTMATHGPRLNPYKLGIELFRHIEHRWDTGKFGKEWEECDDLDQRRSWDRQLGLGRKKIFEVRKIYNDITFIDTFLTPEFCRENNMFSYAFQEQAGQYVIESREFEKVKKRLLHSLTNFGKPWIFVIDGNYRNRGELLLKHEHNGVDLRLDYAREVLSNLQVLWSRPVHLQTVVEGKASLLSFDGTEHTLKTGGDDDSRRNPAGKTR